MPVLFGGLLSCAEHSPCLARCLAPNKDVLNTLVSLGLNAQCPLVGQQGVQLQEIETSRTWVHTLYPAVMTLGKTLPFSATSWFTMGVMTLSLFEVTGGLNEIVYVEQQAGYFNSSP